jgi:hypothetical protein
VSTDHWLDIIVPYSHLYHWPSFVGVFYMVGSNVAEKFETTLALTDILYHGGDNISTINRPEH